MSPNFFQFGRFLDPSTFEEIDAAGFVAANSEGRVNWPSGLTGQGLFLYPTTRAQFDHDFPRLSQLAYSHVVEIERHRSEWIPAAGTIPAILRWAGESGSLWSATFSIQLKTMVLTITFTDLLAAVECKLLFG